PCPTTARSKISIVEFQVIVNQTLNGNIPSAGVSEQGHEIWFAFSMFALAYARRSYLKIQQARHLPLAQLQPLPDRQQLRGQVFRFPARSRAHLTRMLPRLV